MYVAKISHKEEESIYYLFLHCVKSQILRVMEGTVKDFLDSPQLRGRQKKEKEGIEIKHTLCALQLLEAEKHNNFLGW